MTWSKGLETLFSSHIFFALGLDEKLEREGGESGEKSWEDGCYYLLLLLLEEVDCL